MRAIFVDNSAPLRKIPRCCRCDSHENERSLHTTEQIHTAQTLHYMKTMRSLLSLRGRFAALVLLVALVVPSGLAAADTATAHQECEQEGHSCGTSALVAPCCCHAGPVDPPASTATTAGRQTLTHEHGALVQAAPFLVVPTDADGVSAAVLRMHAPPHGYYRADLSLLLSILLI
jgi:hypothetical protein